MAVLNIVEPIQRYNKANALNNQNNVQPVQEYNKVAKI